MSKEKVVLSFIAVVLGILVTGVAFYLYQATKTIPPSKIKTIKILSPSPSPKSSIYLTIKEPEDEKVVGKKVVTVSGTTQKDATIVVLSPVDEDVVKPSGTGDFSTTINIDDGQNNIEITAISPNGEEITVTRTVTFSIEEF